MTNTLSATCLAVVLSAACTAYAQQPPAPAAPADAMAPKTTKLTGCLKSGADAGTFELATSKKDNMATSAPVGAAAPSSETPAHDSMANADPKTVKLAPSAGVALTSHLNHQIEVSGSWEQASGSAGATTDAGQAKTFSVTAVKMIAASCTTGSN